MLAVNKKPCKECYYKDDYKIPYANRSPLVQDMWDKPIEYLLDAGIGHCHKSSGKRACYGIVKDINHRKIGGACVGS